MFSPFDSIRYHPPNRICGGIEPVSMAESTDGVVISQYQTTRIRHMFSSYKRSVQIRLSEIFTDLVQILMSLPL